MSLIHDSYRITRGDGRAVRDSRAGCGVSQPGSRWGVFATKSACGSVALSSSARTAASWPLTAAKYSGVILSVIHGGVYTGGPSAREPRPLAGPASDSAREDLFGTGMAPQP